MYETVEVSGMVLGWCPDGRFMEDRCLSVTDERVILFDGVLLNKHELLHERGVDSIEALLHSMMNADGVTATLATLRGPFSGAVLDLAKNTLQVFGNHTGDTAAFLYQGTAGPLASNSFDLLMRLLDGAGQRPTFDEHAARMMLSYGFMTDDHTFAEEVRRATPGSLLSVPFDGSMPAVEIEYWRLEHTPVHSNLSYDDALARFDQLFRTAVRRCFDKDLEYGYSHLADISGGLDARMVNVVARDLGYGPITNVTYSDWHSDDRRYALRLAEQLGNDSFYHPTGSGRSLLSPEAILQLNSGMCYYGSITGGFSTLQALNFSKFGLEHTGLFGGAVADTYASSPQRRPAQPGSGANSRINIEPPGRGVSTDDEEIFIMTTRGFRGQAATYLMRSHFTFAASPFADIDVLDFAFRMPLEWRLSHRFQLDWIQAFYPHALDTPSTQILPREKRPIRTVGRFARKAMNRILVEAQARLNRSSEPRRLPLRFLLNNMNPADFWYAENQAFRQLVEEAEQYADRIPINAQTRSNLKRSLRGDGTAWDRVQAITVTTMHRMYFLSDQVR
ncbi:asparagine synthetase B family protein [Leucobacter tenebrionis]|uniref:hypothetical protein n=1 Tax=Leucobacter tenebrionis TaxID=2873270 RepID=UPI001CA7B597|nr:hypothetical protein [Leucobacter tenebrionis]QZY53059.1 hypothetical protein KVY00_06440 [Leucobacter tenebrionis]